MTDGEVWLRAWCSTASGWNSKHGDATRYADICLKEFRERFPLPKPLETQYCGTPLSELSDEERAEMRRTLAQVPVRARDAQPIVYEKGFGPGDGDAHVIEQPPAIATEARRAETPKSGSVHEGAGRKASPNPSPESEA